MRKYALLVLLTAFIVAFTSSCGLIVKDAAVDAQTVIIEVAGKTIVKADVLQAVENVLDYQEYMYSYYGMTLDRTDADTLSSARESAVAALIEEAVTQQKIAENGFDQFTEEELAAINETVDTTYEANLSNVKTYFFADSQLTGDELNAAIETKMLELGYGTKEALLESEKLNASTQKLKDMVVKDVAVTEDEILAEYNNQVASAISTYATTPTQYASDVSSGAILYYTPVGYRYVKNLLIKISDEDKTALSALQTELDDKQASLEATNTAIGELPEDSSTDTDEQKQSREELTAQADTLNAEIADLNAQISTLTETAFSAIQPKVDEVLAKIAAGEDFDALIAAYGEDPGMQTEPQKSTGYLVCANLTTYVTEFLDASMALQSVNDVSEPFRSSVGVHIVQYASDLPDGQVPLADIHDQVSAALLESKQDTLYDETISQWITDADAKTYMDRLDD